jgi:hypothetical protein
MVPARTRAVMFTCDQGQNGAKKGVSTMPSYDQETNSTAYSQRNGLAGN